jgi:hypothetical protein
MAKFKTVVTFGIEVEVDESMFTDTFMEEFRRDFYPFYDIQRHVEHIAQLEARGLLDDFTEGYGPIKYMGIKARVLGWDVDEVERV